MLDIAKAAKASNETLYRWYGDKNGLFQTMVESNARATKTALDAA
ncbi:TetR family transcriptional regulator [Rhizobium leguminosarum]|nr:TetR family transcriptional regulator [Rhizobium leguminosarum]